MQAAPNFINKYIFECESLNCNDPQHPNACTTNSSVSLKGRT
jgi:hypothetical protein